MLMALEKCLKSKVLLSYWHERHNLFDSLNPEYLENVARQLEKILSMIKFDRNDNGGLVKKGYFREVRIVYQLKFSFISLLKCNMLIDRFIIFNRCYNSKNLIDKIIISVLHEMIVHEKIWSIMKRKS